MTAPISVLCLLLTAGTLFGDDPEQAQYRREDGKFTNSPDAIYKFAFRLACSAKCTAMEPWFCGGFTYHDNGTCNLYRGNEAVCVTPEEAAPPLEVDTGSGPPSHRRLPAAASEVPFRGNCAYVTVDSYEHRLTGGDASCTSGRVEVRQTGASSWGQVCDDSWDDTDATVFCRSIGATCGFAACCSPHWHTTGVVFFMDEVACSGSESHLLQCQYSGWGSHDCEDDEVASVTCT